MFVPQAEQSYTPSPTITKIGSDIAANTFDFLQKFLCIIVGIGVDAITQTAISHAFVQNVDTAVKSYNAVPTPNALFMNVQSAFKSVNRTAPNRVL